MKKILFLICRLLLGFFLCASGTALALRSNLGLCPWDVFHQGLSNVTGLTIGEVSILVGIIVVLITVVLKLEIGLGTIANMVMIGLFTDLIINMGIIPESKNVFTGILLIIASLVVLSIGSYFYISCGLGCGPRDGLMVVLIKISGRSVRLVRFCIEFTVLVIGWILSGTVGIGTVIAVLGVGYCIQLIFKLFRFNVSKLKHKNIKEGVLFFIECLNKDEEETKLKESYQRR